MVLFVVTPPQWARSEAYGDDPFHHFGCPCRVLPCRASCCDGGFGNAGDDGGGAAGGNGKHSAGLYRDTVVVTTRTVASIGVTVSLTATRSRTSGPGVGSASLVCVTGPLGEPHPPSSLLYSFSKSTVLYYLSCRFAVYDAVLSPSCPLLFVHY